MNTKARHYIKSIIPCPHNTSARFCTLDELRKAVADMELEAREMGVHPAEVIFTGGMMELHVSSQKLSDGSVVLNAGIAMAALKLARGE